LKLVILAVSPYRLKKNHYKPQLIWIFRIMERFVVIFLVASINKSVFLPGTNPFVHLTIGFLVFSLIETIGSIETIKKLGCLAHSILVLLSK